MNVIELLTFTVEITSGINGLFQYIILNSKIRKLEKEWPRIKSLVSLISLKNFLMLYLQTRHKIYWMN
ncbi:MAG: hypothetical protein RXQ98_08155 [Sulfolobaceae archaeon]